MSFLFRNAVTRLTTPALTRNITTTAVKRSSDPIIGHPHQEGIPGAVITLLSLSPLNLFDSFLIIEFAIQHQEQILAGLVVCLVLWQRLLDPIHRCPLAALAQGLI